MPRPSVSALLILLSVIVFVLVAFGATVASLSALEFAAIGLALFAAAHLVP